MAKLVINLTRAGDDTDRATVALVIANASVASGVETTIFLSSEGVRLATTGYADALHEEGFKPMRELIADFQAGGGQFWICSPCFKKRGFNESQLIGSATIVGGAKLVEVLAGGAASLSY